MTGTDEFTFPVITDSHSCSIDSPPLWRLSPAKDSNEEDKEEKMDVLWEDFNEELSGSSSSSSSSSSSRLKPGKRSGSGRDMAEMGCAQALKLSKNPGTANAIFSSRKPGFVVFIKVLKKLFLLHHSHRPKSVKNNRRWWSNCILKMVNVFFFLFSRKKWLFFGILWVVYNILRNMTFFINDQKLE